MKDLRTAAVNTVNRDMLRAPEINPDISLMSSHAACGGHIEN